MPNVLVIGASRYFVAADDERRSIEVAGEGQYAIYDRNVTGVLSLFRAVPVIQSTCTLDGVKYMVADVAMNFQTDTLAITLRRSDGA